MILELLAKKPSTRTEIVEAIGIHRDRFYFYRDNLKKQIHIKEWIMESPGSPTTPVYALGNEPDAPRPAPVSKTIHKRLERKRKDRNEKAKIRMRAYRKRLKEKGIVPIPRPKPAIKPHSTEPVIQRDPWLSAFFGSAGGQL